MNIKLLRRVQKFLLAEPRRFDMCNWVQAAEYSVLLEKPPCGTACCIAGAAVILDRKIDPGKALAALNGVNIPNAARTALGLTFGQEDQLFYTGGWPQKFQDAYYQAKTPLQRAKIGVARIDRFIKTKGAE